MGKLEAYFTSKSDAANAPVPEGAHCWICLSGGDDGDGDGPLLRGCACRGDAGYAHVSCLADAAERQWKAEREKAWSNPIVPRPGMEYDPWSQCGICRQSFTGRLNREMALIHYEKCKDLPMQYYPEVRDALSHMGETYNEQNEPEKALPYLERICKNEKKFLQSSKAMGVMMPSQLDDFATHANNYGGCLAKVGRGNEAMRTFEEALDMLDLGKPNISRDSDTGAFLINNIAQMHVMGGEPDRALPLLREVLEIRERHIGKNHPDYIDGVIALVCAMPFDMHAEAIPMIQDNIERSKRLLGPQHPKTMKCMSVLAGIDPNANVGNAVGLDTIVATVDGIQSRSELNGKKVAVRKFLKNKMRYEVRLCSDGDGKRDDLQGTLSLKPSNLILEKGTLVRIHGLLSANQYNGKTCKILAFDDEKKRYAVELYTDKTVRFRVKQGNCLPTSLQVI